jgi:hypothetical protein
LNQDLAKKREMLQIRNCLQGVICFEGAAETLNADEEIKRKYLAV